jgi:hypothetical protein
VTPRIVARYRRYQRLSKGEQAALTLAAFLGVAGIATWMGTVHGGLAFVLGLLFWEAMRPVWAWLRAVE